ncbi:defensin beta 4A-like [Saimiri boliviensis]|uniref:defensin beta 4A-like n=1 Tax=Saimiri boliviensis TaxID=27679 RepID=UPI00193EA159|nr:beta-defensin 4A-like [Saimiri boliviensis boliviensis]
MKVLYLLFSFLFVFLMPLPGVFGDINNPVSCIRSGAICHPAFCPRNFNQVGTCGIPFTKCCKKK